MKDSRFRPVIRPSGGYLPEVPGASGRTTQGFQQPHLQPQGVIPGPGDMLRIAAGSPTAQGAVLPPGHVPGVHPAAALMSAMGGSQPHLPLYAPGRTPMMHPGTQPRGPTPLAVVGGLMGGFPAQGPADTTMSQSPMAALQPAVSGNGAGNVEQDLQMLLNGNIVPPDLEPYLHQGRPIRVGYIHPNESLSIARFPKHVDPMQGEEVLAGREVIQKSRQSDVSVQPVHPRRNEVAVQTALGQWSMVIREYSEEENNSLIEKSLAGDASNIDTRSHFAVIEHEEFLEVVPISSWINFRLDVAPGANMGKQGGQIPADCDAAERSFQLLERRKKKHYVQISRLMASEDRGDTPKTSDMPVEDSMADLGFARQDQKRKKKLMRRRNAGVRSQKDDDVGDSALNLGHIKKARVDWDFDDDGNATDDEEGDDADLLPLQPEEEDVDAEDTEDDAEEDLNPFGREVNRALENQKNTEADEELAQFSDDEEEEDGESDISRTKTLPAPIPASAPATPAPAIPAPVVSGQTYETIKRRLVRALQKSGGTMPIRALTAKFKIQERNETFTMLQQAIRETCEAREQKDPATGSVVRVVELKEQKA